MTGESAKELLGSFMDGLTAGGEEIAVMAEMLPAMRAFVEQFGTDDFVCTMHPLPPTPPTSHPGLDGATVWRFEHGRIAEVQFHLDHDAALEAAGLDPRLPDSR